MSIFETSDSPLWDAGRVKIWLWITGLASVALGALGILSPFLLTLAAELMFGAVLGALGAVQILRAVFSGDVASRTWTLIFGVVSLTGGALLVLYPLEGMLTLTILLGTFFIAGGILKLFGAWQMRPPRMREFGLTMTSGRGWLAVAGAISLLLGLVLIFGLPSTAAWALGLLLGIDLLFLGFAEIALATGWNTSHADQAAV